MTAVLVAFLDDRTWEQAALARRVGVTTRTLRACLLGLAESGVPLESESENRSRVYWSVPAKWLPGATALTNEEVASCARLLARTPRTDARDRLLAKLLRRPSAADASNEADASTWDSALVALEDGLRERRALRASYRSTTGREPRERTLSIQRIVYREPMRVVAHCHRTARLRWFRVDRFGTMAPASCETFVGVDPKTVDDFVRESLDGFHGDGAVLESSFFVAEPDARWVAANMPSMDADIVAADQGIHVRVRTTGLDVLARWLVGLGAAVRIETPELRECVALIAERSLATHRRLGIAKVRDGRSTPVDHASASRRA